MLVHATLDTATASGTHVLLGAADVHPGLVVPGGQNVQLLVPCVKVVPPPPRLPTVLP